jgi:hypothetical protein
VKDGDLFIPSLGADGELVALPVETAAKDGDLLIPALCSDGNKAAVAVATLEKDGDVGIPVVCTDDLMAAVALGKMPEFWFSSNVICAAGPMLAYDPSLKKGILPNIGGITHPYATQLHSGTLLKKVVSMESQINQVLTTPCTIDGYFYSVSWSWLSPPQPIVVRCYDNAGTLVFESSLSSWTWAWKTYGGSNAYSGTSLLVLVKCHPVSLPPDRYLVLFHRCSTTGDDVIRTVINGNSGALVSQSRLLTTDLVGDPASAPVGDGSFWIVSNYWNGTAWEIWRGRYTKDSVISAFSLWFSAPADPADLWRQVSGVIECGNYVIVAVNLYEHGPPSKYSTIYYRFDKATGLNTIELWRIEVPSTSAIPYVLRFGTSSRLYMERYETSGSKWILCWMDLSTGAVTDVTDGTDAFLLGEWNGKGLVAIEHGPTFTPPNQPLPLKYINLTTGVFE